LPVSSGTFVTARQVIALLLDPRVHSAART